MSVVFTTQQGRTLVNYDMDAEEMRGAVGGLVEVTGMERGSKGTVIHVNTRHVVEWWDEPRGPVTMQDIVGVTS